MPKHASKAQAKPLDRHRFQPLVECLEDRSVPGNTLMGPGGLMDPTAWLALNNATTPPASQPITAKAAHLVQPTSTSNNGQRQAAPGSVYGSSQAAQIAITAAEIRKRAATSSAFSQLPDTTNIANLLKGLQANGFVLPQGAGTTFANAYQAIVAHWGAAPLPGNAPPQSAASKEWTNWLSAINPRLVAMAEGATALSGPISGGGGGTGGGTGQSDGLVGEIGTPQWLVTLNPGVSSPTWAARVGAVHKRAAYTANTFVWEFPATMPRDQVVARLNSLTQVASFQQLTKPILARNFAPNDPLFPDQWHLKNTGQGGGNPGVDANVSAAWDTVRGRGVEIGILDDGIDYTHRDLRGHYDFNNDFDYVNGVNDGGVKDDDDKHGTSVSGVAAGIGNNTIGVTGAAPEARITSMKILGGSGASQLGIADALSNAPQTIDIYNNSWGPAVGYIADFTSRGQMLAAIERGARFGRGGLGSIYVFSAGNSGGADHHWDANFMVPNNSPYVITVGAIDNLGEKSEYSQAGANVFIGAPSNGGSLGIVTTDRPGDKGYDPSDYTFDFGGTSSAAPLVSGVIALMLEANPNLGYRDVQEIIARTAKKVDPTDSDWTTNGAGLHINHKFGFGMINAAAAVNMARTWNNLAPVQSFNYFAGANLDIPDNDRNGVTSTINVAQNFIVERVVVTVSAEYPERGDLQISLKSPMGTTSILQPQFNDPDPDTAIHTLPFRTWTYTSTRHLGETAQGNWSLNIADLVAGFNGTFNDWSITFYGRPTTGGGGGGGGGTGGDVSNDSRFEPNDSVDRASSLGLIASDLNIANLGIVAKATQDRDWFRFTPTQSGSTTVSIDMQDNSGDLDIRLYRRLSTGALVQVAAGQRRQAGGTESITFNALKNQTYYLWVYGFQGAKGAYDLNIDVPTAP